MNHLKFTHDKLSVEQVTDLVNSSHCGAISVFVGTTRDTFEGKNVVRLEYEAYESMGLKAMQKICGEIRDRWPEIGDIAIYHRLGTVPVKESSVVIAISSPHRTEAIQATEFCINNVKQSVTVWKKEIYQDSGSEWKENKELPNPKKLKLEPKIETPFIPPHLIQIKVSNNDLNKRIEDFMARKREEVNIRNIKEFCSGDRLSEFTCARIDATMQKRKDSKGHLQVNRVLNTYHRDQTNSEYLTKFIPQNGIGERLQNLETQLSLTCPIPKNIYKRLKLLEDRMLYLESISPEYVHFWDKANLPNGLVKKKVFSVTEIDGFIADLEKKCMEEKGKIS